MSSSITVKPNQVKVMSEYPAKNEVKRNKSSIASYFSTSQELASDVKPPKQRKMSFNFSKKNLKKPNLPDSPELRVLGNSSEQQGGLVIDRNIPDPFQSAKPRIRTSSLLHSPVPSGIMSSPVVSLRPSSPPLPATPVSPIGSEHWDNIVTTTIGTTSRLPASIAVPSAQVPTMPSPGLQTFSTMALPPIPVE